MPHFTCNLDSARAPLCHLWCHTVGSSHAALALRADRQRQMLRALSSGGTTVFNYAANVTPPKNWRKWAGLIQRLVERDHLSPIRVGCRH